MVKVPPGYEHKRQGSDVRFDTRRPDALQDLEVEDFANDLLGLEEATVVEEPTTATGTEALTLSGADSWALSATKGSGGYGTNGYGGVNNG